MNQCSECKEPYYEYHICIYSEPRLSDIMRAIDDLHEKVDKLKKDEPIKVNFSHGTILSANMSMGSEFGSHPVYWVGNEQGTYYVNGPDKVLGQRIENSKAIREYEMPSDDLMYTTMSNITPYVYFTKEEAEKKCEELKSGKCKWGENNLE